MLAMWWEARAKRWFCPFLVYTKMLAIWWDSNENCEAILGGQNAGFALF